MSTWAPTLSFDQASSRAALKINSDKAIDGYQLQLGVFAAWKKAYGEKMGVDASDVQVEVLPITVRQHANSTGLQTGTETLDLNVQSTDEVGPRLRMGNVVRPVVVNQVELRQCGDQAGLNEFLLKRYKMTKASCEREAARHIVAGGVAVYESCVPSEGAMYSLNGIDHATYGFIEHRAFGSQTNVLGGFSKATWSDRPQTQNIVMDLSSNFAANGLSQMYALRTRMRKYMRNPGNNWYGLITEAMFNNYKRALGSQERFLKESDLNGGWMPMAFGDVALYVEEYMPISTTYGGSTSNTNKASMFIFNAKSFYPKWAKGMSVAMGGETSKVPGGRFEFGPGRRLPQNVAWATEINIGFNLMAEGFAEFGVALNGETWS